MKLNKTNTLNDDAVSRQKILVIDDNVVDLNIAAEIVKSEGYQVLIATNGLSALDIFAKEKPDMVIVDILMEGMDGYEVSNRIGQLAKDEFVPILFLTSLETIDSKVRCYESGGIDIVSKPFDKTVLASKINTFISLSSLYQDNNLQRQELEYHNAQLKQNYDVANKVFEKVMHSDVLMSPAVKYSLSPVSVFNGDILLAAYRPSGELHIMLGDFTGHGISAAIGAIPAADIFYEMTAKGFDVAEILQEMNTKMLRILPRGLFLALCFIAFDKKSEKLSIWNAGLPDVLVYNNNSKRVTERFSSNNYPLGISNVINLSDTVERYHVNSGDRLLLFTDGVIETRNKDKELYGIDRVVNYLNNCRSEWLIDSLQLNLVKFAGGENQLDDVSIFEIDFTGIDKPIAARTDSVDIQPLLDSSWKIEYDFGVNILKVLDPIPNVIQTIMEMQKLNKYKQSIFIIIRELFVNALDHGLLELDSGFKQAAKGFSVYMNERQSRLGKLQKGNIKLVVEHTGTADGGVLEVIIEDSGKGFDSRTIQDHLQLSNSKHGRGIFMVNMICESLHFSDTGNRVHAAFHWTLAA